MLRSNNHEWGFYGTARQINGEAIAEKAWRVSFKHVQDWMGWSDQMTRDFLDSKCGRWYADNMAGKADWRRALTHYPHLERDCRGYFKDVKPVAYKIWCKAHGHNPTERLFKRINMDQPETLKAVNSLLGLDFTEADLRDWIKNAGPAVQALALILADLPEEIREIYTEEAN